MNRRNLHGRLNTVQRLLDKRGAELREGVTGFATSGPGVRTGPGAVSPQRLVRLVEAGAYVHVIGAPLPRPARVGAGGELAKGPSPGGPSEGEWAEADVRAYNAAVEAQWAAAFGLFDRALRGEVSPEATPHEEAEVLVGALTQVASGELEAPSGGGALSGEACRPERTRAALARLLDLIDAEPPVLFGLEVGSVLGLIVWVHAGAGAGEGCLPGRTLGPEARADAERVASAFALALADDEAAGPHGDTVQAQAWDLVAALAQGGSVADGASDPAILRVLEALSGRVDRVDAGLLYDRDALLRLLLTAIRADRERFAGLYDGLRAEHRLPTQFEPVLRDFPDLLPVSDRLLVLWQEGDGAEERF